MNKNEFLKIIRAGLNDFSPQELNEIISDYETHFRDAMSDGKTEEEIINTLGDPFAIINRYRSGSLQSVPKYKSTNNNDYKNTTSYNNGSPKRTHSNPNTVDTLLKIAIIIVAIFLIGPFGLAVGSILFSLALVIVVIPFALSLSGIALLLGKSGLSLFGFAVPTFLADFPTSVISLITMGSILATILVTILSVYIIKALIIFTRKIFNKLFNKGVN